MRTVKSIRGLWVLIIILFALGLPRLALGQGCALCYTQAAASGARMIRALKSGIVILIIPPVSICVGAIFLAYRRRDEFNQADAGVNAASDW